MFVCILGVGDIYINCIMIFSGIYCNDISDYVKNIVSFNFFFIFNISTELETTQLKWDKCVLTFVSQANRCFFRTILLFITKGGNNSASDCSSIAFISSRLSMEIVNCGSRNSSCPGNLFINNWICYMWKHGGACC